MKTPKHYLEALKSTCDEDIITHALLSLDYRIEQLASQSEKIQLLTLSNPYYYDSHHIIKNNNEKIMKYIKQKQVLMSLIQPKYIVCSLEAKTIKVYDYEKAYFQILKKRPDIEIKMYDKSIRYVEILTAGKTRYDLVYGRHYLYRCQIEKQKISRLSLHILTQSTNFTNIEKNEILSCQFIDKLVKYALNQINK